jgi:hypothetical protein
MGKGVHVNRKEPKGPEIMEAYEDSCHIFLSGSLVSIMY